MGPKGAWRRRFAFWGHVALVGGHVSTKFPTINGIGVAAEFAAFVQRATFDGGTFTSQHWIAAQFRRFQPASDAIDLAAVDSTVDTVFQPAVDTIDLAAVDTIDLAAVDSTVDAVFQPAFDTIDLATVHSAFDAVFQPAVDALVFAPIDSAQFAEREHSPQFGRYRVR